MPVTMKIAMEEDQESVCFPESQIMRPHVARIPGVKKDGTTAVIAYCALTGTGIHTTYPGAKQQERSSHELHFVQHQSHRTPCRTPENLSPMI